MNKLLKGMLILGFLLATCHGDLAEILLEKARYNNYLENNKKTLHARVEEEKTDSVNNIKQGNIVIILKDNAVYIYDRARGGFIGRSMIADFLKTILGVFTGNNPLVSVDTSKTTLTNKPHINNIVGDNFWGQNIVTIEN